MLVSTLKVNFAKLGVSLNVTTSSTSKVNFSTLKSTLKVVDDV